MKTITFGTCFCGLYTLYGPDLFKILDFGEVRMKEIHDVVYLTLNHQLYSTIRQQDLLH